MPEKTSRAKRRLDFDDNEASLTSPATRKPASKKLKQNSSSSVKRTRQSKLSFSSPKKEVVSTTSAVAVVTPEKKTKEKTQDDDTGYVPTYLHKNLGYHRKGAAVLPETTRKVFDLVQKYYQLPKDLETSRSFGPLSGTCYEEKAIDAYQIGMLQGMDEKAPEICVVCAEVGHRRNDCPSLI